MVLQAKNIDDVISIMDDIIRDAMQENSRLGYFASLYRTVTIVVRDECNLGLFEDNERMRRLDTIFANRYFAAYDCFRKQAGVPSDCWTASFEVMDDKKLLIVQHLLLGMSAHIALDLGVATAEVANGELTDSLKRDFYRLNNILTSLIDVVQEKIAEASPYIHYFDRLAWRGDETFVSYAINHARDNALEFAEELINLPDDKWEEAIRARDCDVAQFSRKFIAHTEFPLNLLIWLVNLRENKDARTVTQIMSDEKWQQETAAQVESLVADAVAQGVDLSKRDTQIMRIPKELKS